MGHFVMNSKSRDIETQSSQYYVPQKLLLHVLPAYIVKYRNSAENNSE